MSPSSREVYKMCLFSLRFSVNVYRFVCPIIILLVSTPLLWGSFRSPAGGNCLELDGEDDYAVLDFETYGTLFEKGTRNLTVEAWVYPTSAPGKDEFAIILGQQAVLYTTGPGHPWYQKFNPRKGDLLLSMIAYIASGHGGGNTGDRPLGISPYQWHHIAFQIEDRQIIRICDDCSPATGGATTIEHDLWEKWIPRRDFVLGGYGGEALFTASPCRRGSFAGYIDEVRLSTVTRYKTRNKPFTPQGRFEPDEHTVALWHFDELSGSEVFLDSSGNEYHLVGMNGACVQGPLAVDGSGKLAATWAGIKCGF
jgi:hypothetical protein